MPEFLKLKKSNCKNCHKCIRNCPVKSIRFSGGQANIVPDECILCGQCVVVCPQNAKEIVSEREKVSVLMQENERVVASVAPSFVAAFGGIGIRTMERALVSLGFAAAEETARGAVLVKDEYDRLLREGAYDVLISSCCQSVNLLIQKYFPALLPCLAPVLSPMQAHAQDMKRRCPGAKVVFIGPCLAKKDEAVRYPDSVDAVLTFEELADWMREKSVRFEPVPEEDGEESGRTRIFPTTGGVIGSMSREAKNYTYMTVEGVPNCIAALRELETAKPGHVFIEMSACVGSCIGGPAMGEHRSTPIRDQAQILRRAGQSDFRIEAPGADAMRKLMNPIEHEAEKPSQEEIRQILAQMGKTKPSDELNCGTCGYNSCREKAIAVYQGKAEVSMCLPFLMERAESFSSYIVDNTPNGILVLNDDYEVQQINRPAMELLSIRRASDVIGEPVVRILDPRDFMTVCTTGRSISNKRVYLAEYQRWAEETIVYDRAYRRILCILRDVTDAEESRTKKEELSRNTAEVADRVVEKQMRIVQEIASLLGETAAETKIALTKLKESMRDE